MLTCFLSQTSPNLRKEKGGNRGLFQLHCISPRTTRLNPQSKVGRKVVFKVLEDMKREGSLTR
ncbi:hypothetical protein CROQUDRAFT_652794 [Cronartium quercuum f. sp. fusiforme G11]|uniref:Uncharacterized protein n=1 Tax=Cronartium quercuum f. sp. fusiforme G11 TaxID=708437 RepID=A0A9P6NV39_9BASI|nr:hypothetical protein CROQUDRAFT_652794 [Cronartium quercuum f. sp. fusiforme G11]